MKKNEMTEDKSRSTRHKAESGVESNYFYRRIWRNWFLLAGVLILTTIGLATAIPPLLSERIVNPWPWVKTDLVLLAGLSLTVLSFIGYMTQQQRFVMELHRKLERVQAESDKRAKQHAERLYALTSLSRIMGTETNLQNIFNAITKICAETFQSERASLMLCDRETEDLVVQSVCGRPSEDILYVRQKVGEGIAGWVAKNRKPLLISCPEDCKSYPDLKFRDSSIISTMVTPIVVRDELVGVINVSSNSKDILYERDDLRALQIFAENAGVCIRHTEHMNWMKKICRQLNVDASGDMEKERHSLQRNNLSISPSPSGRNEK